MVEQDTIKLLRECDAGIKMGVSSIDDVLDYVKSDRLKKDLEDSKDEHKKLDKELHEEINFRLGSGPVFRGESINGKILNTVSYTVAAEFFKVLRTNLMSCTSGKMSVCGPSSVAVHYYTQRYGDLKVTRIISLFFFVSE
jgi:hypothetical protein